MYKVIHGFDDLQDAKQVKGGVVYHHYDVGDKYPRANAPTPSDARIAELCSTLNRQGKALIEPLSAAEKAAFKAALDDQPENDDAASEDPEPEAAGDEKAEDVKASAGGEQEEPAEAAPKPKRTRKK